MMVHTLSKQMQPCVKGRINKIHQPSEHHVIFHIRAAGQTLKLLLSAHPTYPRVHVTERQAINPQEPPMFCMLLRKHCEGGIIQGIEQMEAERVIHIHIQKRDELGDMTRKTLIIELMGRHSNIILIDPKENKILDGIHHITPAISSYRVIMPGYEYVTPPKQHKQNPFVLTDKLWAQMMDSITEADSDLAVAKWIVDQCSGISPLAAKEILYRSHIPLDQTTGQLTPEQVEQLTTELKQFIEQIQSGTVTPHITESKEGKYYFYCTELTHLNGTVEHFSSIHDCLEAYYSEKAERDTIKQKANDIIKKLENENSKNKKKLIKLARTLQEANQADKYRIFGELLTASMHEITKGDQEIEVINYYDENQEKVKITLDPMLSPSENTQKYFKKYSKYKNSLTIVNEQIEQTEQEIIYIENILQQLMTADINDLQEIRDELVKQGYIKKRNKKEKGKQKKNKNNIPTMHCYTSSEGIPIYVGKNNIQNEYISMRFARSNHTWLHTKDIHGSHVVIYSSEFGDQTLEEAAMLSAYFSQARQSSQVPVDYTFIRHVRKPNGAKPGFVIYDNQKTLYITPDEEKIQRLKHEMK